MRFNIIYWFVKNEIGCQCCVNPAIVTNTCTTEFVPFLGVNAFDADAFEYFPNPTSGIVTFAFKNTATTIDLSELEKGIYLITIKGNGQQKTIKIVQQ